MTHSFTPEDFRRWDDAGFEAAVVAALLTRLRLTRYREELLQLSQSESGSRRLSLLAFQRRFPTFPVYLHSVIISRLPQKLDIPYLLHKFTDSVIYTTYLKLLEDAIPSDFTDYPLGMVFRWPRQPEPMLLLRTSQPPGNGYICQAGESELFWLGRLADWARTLKWTLDDE